MDHNWALFSLNLIVKVSYPLRYPKRVDWRKFGLVIKTKFSGACNGNICTIDKLAFPEAD